MPVDNDIIKSKIHKLISEIKPVNERLKQLEEVKQQYTLIKAELERVPNESGGHDMVLIIPNPNKLSDENRDKVRQVIYDEANLKFDNLDLQ